MLFLLSSFLNKIQLMIFKLSKSFTEKYKIAVKICLNWTILKLSYFYLKHNHQNKLYYFATYNTELILSIVFAIIIIACSILFAIFLVIFSVSSYKLNEKEHSKLGEFFEGLKVPKKQRLFWAISIIRCSIFSVILIVFVPMSSRVTIGILTAFEVFYAIYIFFMKPFDEVKVNIIEVLNECILFFMLVSLNILHGESNWSITLAYIYMIVILWNSLLIFVVIKGNCLLTCLVFIIIEICSKIKSCRSRKSAVRTYFLCL